MTQSHSPQQPRRAVELPAALVDAFVATRRDGDPSGATLIYSWLFEAVLRARAGLPLPPAAEAPPVESGQRNVKWTQTADEAGRWRRELRAAGSSVRAVIADRVQRYIAAGGDPLAAVESAPGRGLSAAS